MNKMLKMRYLQYKMAFIAIILMILSACSNDENTIKETYNTKIVWTSKINDIHLILGDTLFVKADITSDISMHGYEVLLNDLDKITSTSLKAKHIHGKIFYVDLYWVVDVPTTKKMEIEVIAEIDHLDNKLSEKFGFLVN